MKKEINEEKLYEYLELLKVIKETVGKKDLAKVCLSNYTLRTLAGYTEDSCKQNFNEYVKDYMDKLVYDIHNQKVKAAKKNKDNLKLQELSDEAMKMAGYNSDNQNSINPYFKSFVDRTFYEKEMNMLYKAKAQGNQSGVITSYKRLYGMTSYSQSPKYNVVNEYAQTFVDKSKAEYVQMGILEYGDIDRNYAI